MRVVIEVDEELSEECVVIKCRELDEHIFKIQSLLAEFTGDRTILLTKGDKEYYMPMDKVLFFESENKRIIAHTKADMYESSHKLYELEDILPGCFMRVSKSTIVNLNHIFSITKNLASSSVIEFSGTPKQVYVSRNYYKALIERLSLKRR